MGDKDILQLNHIGEHARMSPNGKFLLHNKYIIPLGDGDVITFTDMDAYRSAWSPDGKWLSYDLQELVKIRPAGTLWEVEIDEYINQMEQKQ